jgi:hypothetical protein
MSKVVKFLLSIILFIPKLILDSVASLFKLIILLVIIVAAVFYLGNYSVKSFFSPAHKEIKIEPKKIEE